MKGGASLRSIVEWAIAAALLVSLGWFSSDLAGSWMARRTTLVRDAMAEPPSGVPTGATSVPLLLLLDGREIRTGQTHAEIQMLLGARLAVGEPHRSPGVLGDRITQAYTDNGTRFFITTERMEPGGPVRVTGIYLP